MNFEPQTPFEGFVASELINIKDRLNTLPCKDSQARLNKIENDIANIKGKATVIGAIAGFITSLIGKLFVWK